MATKKVVKKAGAKRKSVGDGNELIFRGPNVVQGGDYAATKLLDLKKNDGQISAEELAETLKCLGNSQVAYIVVNAPFKVRHTL